MEMKSKLYLRIILLSYGMMEKRKLCLFMQISLLYGLRFSVRKNVTNKKERERERERERPGWTYISGPGHFLTQKFHIV